ncbi:hypothetical protein NDU88_000430 [Pleurodeles waltl]|uniref:Uncharacterized protein n=1 Tax=Pleurodeles waltl TaxID=8319 RepID=A0AAV7P3Y7_PLEWA|nr:hypothetical protein NDU88_000430 [Pleurodeles waltl]
MLKDTQGVLEKRGARTEAPKQTPKTDGDPALEELMSQLIDAEHGADTRCDHPSLFQDNNQTSPKNRRPK